MNNVLSNGSLAIRVGASWFAVVAEAVLAFAVGGQGDAAGEVPCFDDNVASLDKVQEASKEGILVQHVVDGVGVAVAVEPQPETRAGEVLGVEIALDEDLDSPGSWASPIDVEGDDGAGTGANVGGIGGYGLVDWQIALERVLVAIRIDAVGLAGIAGAGPVGGGGQMVVAMLVFGEELEAVVGPPHFLETSIGAPAFLDEHVHVGLGVDMGARAHVVVAGADSGHGTVEDIGMGVDGDGLGGAGKLDLDARLGRLDELGGARLVEEGGNAELALCGAGVAGEVDDSEDGGVEGGREQQILQQDAGGTQPGTVGHGGGQSEASVRTEVESRAGRGGGGGGGCAAGGRLAEGGGGRG